MSEVVNKAVEVLPRTLHQKFCPHCGESLSNDPDFFYRPVIRGLWEIGKTKILYDGKLLDLTPRQIQFLYIIATAQRPLTATVVGYRISKSSEDCVAVCRSQKSRIKRYLTDQNIAMPIGTVRDVGYAWIDY